MTEQVLPEMQRNREYAQAARAAAQVVLGWHLDRLRLKVGLVRPVGKHERTVRGTVRLIPTGRDGHGQNWALTVVDVCACPPCPGRGTDGHRMEHCAECCWGSGVEADPDCPLHGVKAVAR